MLQQIYIRNNDNADLKVTVIDDLQVEVLLDDEYLADGASQPVDAAVNGDGNSIISWSCYRTDEDSKQGEDSEVEVSGGSTVEISTN